MDQNNSKWYKPNLIEDVKKNQLKSIVHIFIFLLTAMSIAKVGFSQPDTAKKTSPPPLVTGSADIYFRYNFDGPQSAPYNSFTNFTRSSNSFELGMASLCAYHSFGKVDATVDVGFGKRAEEFAYNDANTRFAIKQLYVSYAPAPAVKFTLGTWISHISYESLDAYFNRNYSVSYIFTYSPASHTGLKADVSLGGKSAFMAGVSNPVDYRTAPGMPKTFIAQFSTGSKNDKLKASFNFAGGKQNAGKKFIQGDIIATWLLPAHLSAVIDGTYQSVQLADTITHKFKTYSWSGVALYINIDPAPWVGVTLRTEYINDHDLYLGLKSMVAPTLSANFKIDNLTIIPEFRIDYAGNKIFYKTVTANTRSTGSFLIAAVYHF